jgi:NAD+ diphosphatase
VESDSFDTAARVPLAFSGAAFDRAPVQRRDPAWLDAQRARTDAAALTVSDDGVWVEDGHLALAPSPPEAVFLGLQDDRPLFASGGEAAHGRPLGLREALAELPAEEAALAAYAASLLSWHRRHRFCANCGAATDTVAGGHERRCPSCEAHHFPRTDPVVIVRVVDEAEDRLLLGRQGRWPPMRFSVLAGFVEPGETLEEAVTREIAEESGIRVTHVSYVASQAWPFPSSLMAGMHAVANGGEPEPGDGELAEVRWFSRAEVEAAAAGRSEVLLPPPFAISRRLIDGWLG